MTKGLQIEIFKDIAQSWVYLFPAPINQVLLYNIIPFGD